MRPHAGKRAAPPSAASGQGPADGTLDLIHQVMHLYRSQQYQVLRDGPHGITHMESKVLGYVQHHPGATQSDLARDSGRDKAQLARLIKGLRDLQLLVAEPDAQDRRNLRLQVTPAGQDVLAALRQHSKQLSARAVAGLSADEKRQLQALLLRVRGNLQGPD